MFHIFWKDGQEEKAVVLDYYPAMTRMISVLMATGAVIIGVEVIGR